ncbi:MAG TPA: hypothetical protein VFK52_08615 [Nocardioidaceae bacterium]|nr:hypothetical protein [Nocardioidaceae bacterium]
MSIENLRRLAERAESVEGRQAARLDELHARIRAARRQRALGSSLVAASVVGVFVAGGALVVRGTDDTREEIPQIMPTPTPSETVAIPDGQVTVTAQIDPGDIRGWELRGTRTNADAGYAGATDLDLVVETGELYGGQSNVTAFCQGDTNTWWVLTFDLDGVDGFRGEGGSQPDGSRGMYGRCSPDDPTEAPTPTEPIDLGRYNAKPMAYPFRMFVTDQVPEAARSCISGGEDAIGCVSTHDLAPVESTDVTFGFGVFEHTTSPRVLTVLDEIRFEALALADGVEYLVDRAVEAAPGSDRLVVRLPASDRSRIVALQTRETPSMEQCVEGLGIDAEDDFDEWQKAVQRECANDLTLQVDGERQRNDFDWYLGSQQVLVPPGGEHLVTVDVVRNDPRNLAYALVIWEARP